MTTMTELFGEVISSYTVAQGVADGTLVEIDASLRTEAGYRIPVTMTRAAWAHAVEWTRDDGCQDETGRTWDVLWMMRGAARRALETERRYAFDLYRVPNTTPAGKPSRSETAQRIRLEVVAQGFDLTGAPCLTVLMVGED